MAPKISSHRKLLSWMASERSAWSPSFLYRLTRGSNVGRGKNAHMTGMNVVTKRLKLREKFQSGIWEFPQLIFLISKVSIPFLVLEKHKTYLKSNWSRNSSNKSFLVFNSFFFSMAGFRSELLRNVMNSWNMVSCSCSPRRPSVANESATKQKPGVPYFPLNPGCLTTRNPYNRFIILPI